MPSDLQERIEKIAGEVDAAQVVDALAARRDEILGRWLEAVSTLPFHEGRREHAVADHIPALFDALVAILRRHAPHATGYIPVPIEDKDVLRAAHEHARARFRQKLRPADIATEFRLLRQEIGVALRHYVQDDTPTPDVVGAEVLVHDALDGSVFLALTAFDEHEEARRRAEAALRESEERFRVLVEAIQDYAIFIMDPDGRIASWNAGAERIKGYTTEEILGQPYTIFFTDEDLQAGKPQRLLRTASEHGRAHDEGWRCRKDGSRYWADALLTALYHEDGTLRGYAKITRDATERRLTEEDRLRRERGREALLAIITHDVKNPLAAIKGIVQVLRRHAERGHLDPEQITRRLSSVDSAITRAVRRLDDLMDFTRQGAGKPIELERATVDLTSLARQVISFHQQATDRHSISLDAGTPAVTGEWDPVRLERVVDNLLSNAIKYSPRGGPIVVTVRVDGEQAILTVQDYGIGIPAPDLPRLTGRYERGSNVSEIPGTGVGLAAVRYVVEQHGGAIAIESEEGRGTTVTVTLPRSQPTANTSSDPSVNPTA